jgi:hypothetical protein
VGNLVSILIPSHNADQWLGDTIRSCLAQTWQDLEIIIVDDASVDKSYEVASAFSDPRIKIVSNTERRGASAARNEAFRHAQGDFIQYLDADDLLAPSKIGIQVNALRDAEPGVLSSSSWAPFKDETSKSIFRPEAVWRDISSIEFLIESWCGGGMMPVFSWLIPRDLIVKAGEWNEELTVNDDGEFFTRVLLAGSKIIFCGDAQGYYRKGTGTTLSGRQDPAALISAYHACALCCSHLLRVDSSPEARRACATAYQRFSYGAYPAVPELVAAAESRVLELGGCNISPSGGIAFRALVSLVGWKKARVIQSLVRRFNHPASIDAYYQRGNK